MFIELCPPEIVLEHKSEIERVVIAKWKKKQAEDIDPEDIVDADFKDTDAKEEASDE